MKGDKLVITEEHVRAARQMMALLLPQITGAPGRFIVTIAGESGSGKSEIAASLSEALADKRIDSVILQQDDYFVYPPKTNEAMRRENIGHVGPSEVRLTLLDRNLDEILKGKTEIDKPLVLFDEDRITAETVSLEGIKVVLVEGTYTTTLNNVHQRIFIDRTYVDTRETRERRAREAQNEVLEGVLEVEHGIIAPQKARADIIITGDYQVKRDETTERQ